MDKHGQFIVHLPTKSGDFTISDPSKLNAILGASKEWSVGNISKKKHIWNMPMHMPLVTNLPGSAIGLLNNLIDITWYNHGNYPHTLDILSYKSNQNENCIRK